LGISFDDGQFFNRTFAGLTVGAEPGARARRLLERYVPTGPKSGQAAEWNSWWKENRAYLFASDAGDYRWYIDPLAKKRGVPSSELRGPKRADQTKLTASNSAP
jgi:hypothetical protein